MREHYNSIAMTITQPFASAKARHTMRASELLNVECCKVHLAKGQEKRSISETYKSAAGANVSESVCVLQAA